MTPAGNAALGQLAGGREGPVPNPWKECRVSEGSWFLPSMWVIQAGPSLRGTLWGALCRGHLGRGPRCLGRILLSCKAYFTSHLSHHTLLFTTLLSPPLCLQHLLLPRVSLIFPTVSILPKDQLAFSFCASSFSSQQC